MKIIKIKHLLGFILGCFDPQTSVVNDHSFHLTLTILSGRHLAPTMNKNVSLNTFVKLEIIGCPVDCAVGTTEVCMVRKYKRRTIHRYLQTSMNNLAKCACHRMAV